MFAFSQIEPERMGRQSRFDVPLNTWLGVKFAHGMDDQVFTAVSRMSAEFQDDSALISPELANKTFGIEGEYGLKWTEPVRIQTAAAMHERKKSELDRLAYMEAATHRTGGAKSVAGFGAAIIGNMMSPLDLALNFFPVVGSSSKAAGMARLGRGALRQRIARGLITEEAIGTGRVAQFSARVLDASVGNAMAEMPVFIQKQRDQAIYGPEDSFINVAAGGLFGGTLHLSLKGIGRLLSGAAELHARLSPRTKELINARASSDFLQDKPIDVTPEIRLDEAAIEAKVLRDLELEATQRDAPETLSTDVAGGTPRDSAAGPVPQYVDVPSETLKIGDTFVQDGIRYKVSGVQETTRNGQTVRTVTGIIDEPLRVVTGDEVSAIAREKRANTERQQRIQDYIAARKPERLAAARQAEIQRQQSEGKILSDEEIQKYATDQADPEKAPAVVSEDISTITKDIEADNQRQLGELEALTPEEKAAIKKQMADELNTAIEKAYKANDAAVDVAVDCILKNL